MTPEQRRLARYALALNKGESLNPEDFPEGGE